MNKKKMSVIVAVLGVAIIVIGIILINNHTSIDVDKIKLEGVDDSYQSDLDNEEYKKSDIIAPVINADTEEVEAINKEIKKDYDDSIKRFEECEDTKICSVKQDYEVYNSNKDTSSIVITKEEKLEGSKVVTYKTYTLDNENNVVGLNKMMELMGYNKEAVNKMVYNNIKNITTNRLRIEKYEGTFDSFISNSYANYEASVANDECKYYVKNNKLHIIVLIEIPIGEGCFEEDILIEF